MSLTYHQAIDYLLGQLPMFQRVGPAAYRADLGNIIALCNKLGNPQRELNCIHIAGTNGKGSVAHIIAAILQQHGYKVGVFTSPHYRDYKERIKINGVYISEEAVTSFVEKNLSLLQSVQASFFEVTTAMAFDYFKEQEVDYAIIETGMGGRLDSTNIITPILSVITNISYDHQQFLGNTLQEIAKEKAGIIKPDIPVVIGEIQQETESVFRAQATLCNAEITFAEHLFAIDDWESVGLMTRFSLRNKTINNIVEFFTDISGDYQQKNIVTAFAAIEQLSKFRNIVLDIGKCKEALNTIRTKTAFLGRWMVIQDLPIVIFDSAHNIGGISEVIMQLKKITYSQLHMVYGTVADKDLTEIFRVLPKDAIYYFCKPDIPRGKDADLLKIEANQYGLKGMNYINAKAAYAEARANAKVDDLIIATGSIFVVSELV